MILDLNGIQILISKYEKIEKNDLTIYIWTLSNLCRGKPLP